MYRLRSWLMGIRGLERHQPCTAGSSGRSSSLLLVLPALQFACISKHWWQSPLPMCCHSWPVHLRTHDGDHTTHLHASARHVFIYFRGATIMHQD